MQLLILFMNCLLPFNSHLAFFDYFLLFSHSLLQLRNLTISYINYLIQVSNPFSVFTFKPFIFYPLELILQSIILYYLRYQLFFQYFFLRNYFR